MSGPHPIEIIGGGLAGLSLGLALRRAGVPVTVFEAGGYPRHRVCGEFISGLGPRTVARLDLGPLLAGAIRHDEVAWFLNGAGEPARIQRLPAPALAISRFVLDGTLAAAVTAAGGEVRPNSRVDPAARRAGRVIATGRKRHHSPWIGLKLHLRRIALARGLEVHLGARSYVGLADVGGGTVNVCGLFLRGKVRGQGRELLLGHLEAAGLHRLASCVASAEHDPGSICAVAGVGFDQRIPRDARVCLGDACAMIPPFTGNGMAMAFQSAEAALDPLVAFARGEIPWDRAGRLIHASLSRRFRLRLASAGALHPFLLEPGRRRVVGALNRAGLLPVRALYAALH